LEHKLAIGGGNSTYLPEHFPAATTAAAAAAVALQLLLLMRFGD